MRRRIGDIVIVADGAPAGAFEIVELAAAQRPKEACQAHHTERQSSRNEPSERSHCDVPIFGRCSFIERSRSALAVTIMDEPDMANAAINGVT